jgi:NhaP-type Na+/H+ or K+/H+ antiporter
MTDEGDGDGDGGVDHTTPVFFLFFMALVALVLLMARWLHHRPRLNSILSEPALVLLVGMFFSFLIKVSVVAEDHYLESHYDEASADDDAYYSANGGGGGSESGSTSASQQSKLSATILSFSGPVFFMALLPPIMFNSGYELKRELFFRHIKPILSFAAVGTTVSGLVTGFALYGAREAGWLGVVRPTLLELLTFGALIAATDSVSVLGVLQAKKVDPHLFSLVFGESALNDAVAIVLFRSFSYLVQLTAAEGGEDADMWDAVAQFGLQFVLQAVGSPAMGIIFSFLGALVFKHLDFRGTQILELSLYILLMYVPFILAEVVHLSGIVAIFFTGMFARRYIEPNVSDETKKNAAVIFKLVAYLAETCIFLDLGLSIFGFSGSFHWPFITFSFVAALLGRAASVYPISFLFNLSLTETFLIPPLPPPAVVTTDAGVDFEGNPSQEVILDDDDDDAASLDSTASSFSSHSSDSIGPHRRRRKRRTPEKRLDKVIPLKFMHVLWFAGLRGAVAYACARDFPDLYGNNDNIVAATMVIVLITIIIMGGFCEPMLRCLDIRMNVCDVEYMREWHLRRSLKGAFHEFGKFENLDYDATIRIRQRYSISNFSLMSFRSLSCLLNQNGCMFTMLWSASESWKTRASSW